ncbi:ribose-phosphate pyrophosphokinase [Candidatus Daviesbacteria bacterium]|nr:ribose-phosphate pyrophosphokinase [Candidatus Daviesbacteria bacterium]
MAIAEALAKPKLVPLPSTANGYQRKDFALVTGTSHPEYAKAVANILGVEVGHGVSRFPDNEIKVSLPRSVRDKVVFLIQPMGPPHQNDYWAEAMLMADAAKRSSAAKVILIAPYLAYARQDRMNQVRSPISIGAMVRSLRACGVDAFMTIDMHAQQSQVAGGEPIPWDDLYGSVHLVPEAMKLDIDDVIATDAGSVARTTAVNGLLQLEDEIGIGIKRRNPLTGKSEYIAMSKSVTGRNCLIVDDQISTAGSLANLSYLLKADGAENIWAIVTHGVFAESALDILARAPFEDKGILITDTIKHGKDVWDHPKLRIVNTTPLIAEAIRRIVTPGEEISPLFKSLYIDGQFYHYPKPS